jgi:hypothetical protein
VGVVNVWFFKRATDTESDQAMYYFRLVEPDFTPMPVYDALAQYFHSSEARRLFPGVHQEGHWALTYDGPWQTQSEPSAQLGAVRRTSGAGASLSFTFEGTDLQLTPGPDPQGTIRYTLDGNPEQTLDLTAGQEVRLAGGLPRGAHSVVVRVASGPVSIDSLTVERRAPLVPWLVGGGVLLALGLAAFVALRAAARRRRWYERSRAGA